MRLLAAVLLVALLAPVPGTALAATPQTSVTDLEDEVMCTICGTLLELSSSPQAQRERAYIARLVAAGDSKAEIEDALVAQYGPEVLATPDESGFELSAYLVPLLGFLVALAALAIAVWRWRRDAGGGGSGGQGESGPSGEDAARLDADIARYDL